MARDGRTREPIGVGRGEGEKTTREEGEMRSVCVRADDGGMANKHSHAQVGAKLGVKQGPPKIELSPKNG
jgi:hypothetical protein